MSKVPLQVNFRLRRSGSAGLSEKDQGLSEKDQESSGKDKFGAGIDECLSNAVHCITPQTQNPGGDALRPFWYASSAHPPRRRAPALHLRATLKRIRHN